MSAVLDRRRTFDGMPLTPGRNVDKLDIAAGVALLRRFGYTDRCTTIVIAYALRRHGRGEEEAAQRGAIDRSFHGIDLTTWYAVLAAAIAGAAKPGWRCRVCGWLAHGEKIKAALWPGGFTKRGEAICDLVCPQCGSLNDFIDGDRPWPTEEAPCPTPTTSTT